MVDTNPQKISELLERGVENIYPSPDFLKSKLESGDPLILYTGYDPTAPTLHIGHGITMMKLRQFQDLGHKIIMLIGDFTGMIGDPTDKTAARQKLTRKQVLQNCKNYKEQASSILNFKGKNAVEVKYNSKWLNKMSFADVLELTSHFTVQRMLERDMFERRMYGEVKCPAGHWQSAKKDIDFYPGEKSYGIRGGEICCVKCFKKTADREKACFVPDNTNAIRYPLPIYLHEFMYPVMQAYDCVAMDVDGEVGGNDQTFNMLAGRDLMKELKNKEKFVLTTKLLVDSTGKKMGKSEGNMIALNDKPEDMYGKVMSWTDDMIIRGFELCTNVSMGEINKLEKEMSDGTNPRDLKMKLAYEITTAFLGEKAAKTGEEHFTKVIQDKDKPTDIPELSPKATDIISVLVEAGFVKTNSEARRAISDGGVKINDEKIIDISTEVKSGDIVQKGKRFFVKIK